MTWTAEDLDRIDAARELEIAVRRAHGTFRPWTPIWVVRAGDDVYVRTWYRRDTGWFGLALRTGRARVRVPGVEGDVRVEDVGAGPSGLRATVDDAYRTKYGGGATGEMVGDDCRGDDASVAKEMIRQYIQGQELDRRCLVPTADADSEVIVRPVLRRR